ncbi:putative teichuronic acid biosynthesis glycosyltransferase TuaC [Novipirellula galeiformis]|uniref:Putative teichuronic acid biosynthesis glycosyltransferase TuaC n=1 Tax=Novipirellula galeiformis TaxID=2528004 RepID=A0A5C6CHX9_9BACT|nr:glycosyltransferase family 4 protein [Novipirellula galeiformis]TWU24008.1 putative teichuronic acid biosynthesis glycosyltransferase TuaC [Novipirellula galeiformis]
MRILLCHNYYQHAGGEDSCFAEEAELLEKHGHTVIRYTRNNDGIGGLNAVLVAGQTIWNPATTRIIREKIKRERIELVHCTNTFPLISPSIYYACNRQRVPVVQSLHNYRLLCANSYFLRDGKVCEACLGKRIALPAIKHRCYRGNLLATTAVVAMQAVHHGIGSWRNHVDKFIALTDFAKSKFIEAGLDEERIAVKPNFVDPAPEIGRGDGDYALFVGRLSSEKGIEVLLRAWQDERCHLPLRIVGDGPMKERVVQAAANNPRIHFVGFQSADEVFQQMRAARFLVVPSLWYEGLPRTIVEAFAVGTPVIASDIGPLKKLVRPEGGGLRFELGNAQALSDVAAKLCQSRETADQLRGLARAEFEAEFSAQANYETLMQIYASAADHCRTR